MFSEEFYSDINIQSGCLVESVFSYLSDWNDYLYDTEVYTPEDLYKTAFLMCYIDKVLKQRELYPNSSLADLTVDTLNTLSDFREHFHFILMSFDESGYISQLESNFLQLRVENNLLSLHDSVTDRTDAVDTESDVDSNFGFDSNSGSALLLSNSNSNAPAFVINIKDFSEDFLSFLHLVRLSSKSYAVVQPESDISDSLLHSNLLSEADVITKVLSFYPFRTFHSHLNVYGFLNYDIPFSDFLLLALELFNDDTYSDDDIEFFKAYFDEILNMYLLKHPVYSKLKLVTEKPLNFYNLKDFQPELSFEMYAPVCLGTLAASISFINPLFSLCLLPFIFTFSTYSFSCLSVLRHKNKDTSLLFHFFQLLKHDGLSAFPTQLLFLLENYFQELFQFEKCRTASELMAEPYQDLFLLFIYTRTNIKPRFIPAVFKKIGTAFSQNHLVSVDSVKDAFLLELFMSEDFSKIRCVHDFYKTAFYRYWKQLYSNPEMRQLALNGLHLISQKFLNSKDLYFTVFFPPLSASYTTQHIRLFLDDLTKLCETPLALPDYQLSADGNTEMSCICSDNETFVSVRENNFYIEKLLMQKEPVITPDTSRTSDNISNAIKDLCLEGELKPYLDRLNTDAKSKFSVLKSVSDKLKSFLVVAPESNDSLKSIECVFDKSDRSLIRDYLVSLSQKDSVSKELLDNTVIDLLTNFLFVFPFLQNHLLMLVEMLHTTLNSYSESSVFDLHSQPFFDFIVNFKQNFKNTANLESQLMLFVGIERSYYSYSHFISSDISNMLARL